MSVVPQEAIKAHGGHERWKRVASIDAKLNFSGAPLDLKGFRGQRRPSVSLDVATPSAAIDNLDGTDEWWMFTPDRVWIQRPDGRLVSERKNPRSAFYGHDRNTPWDTLHLTCFLGYALWSYLTLPFLLLCPGFKVRELPKYLEGRDLWNVLEVIYPDDMPNYGRIQKIYFDTDRMVKRVDYVADGLGGGDAHYCYDPKSFDGIMIPTLRRAVKRTGGDANISGPTSLLFDFTSIRIRDR